jgi:hypothetical protein
MIHYSPAAHEAPPPRLAMVLPAFATRKQGPTSMEAAMRFLVAAAAVALLSGSAYAQMPPMGIPFGEPKASKPVDPAKESDYRSSLGGLPDRKSSDPWGNIRSSPAPAAPAAKKSPPAPKAGTSAKNDPAAKNPKNAAPKTAPKDASTEK